MPTLWFCIISVMLTCYVILDGFDIGAGAIHLFAARTDAERKQVIRAIGPVWDGNEVWLLATGGTLYFAFPALYASSFSGFYLPLMMVLWLLMLRAIGIEFRTHIEGCLEGSSTAFSPLPAYCWRSFTARRWATWCAAFRSARITNFSCRYLLTGGWGRSPAFWIGTPFFQACWRWWRSRAWCTLRRLKTEADLNRRARSIAAVLWPAQLLLTLLSLVATLWIRPALLANYQTVPVGYIIPLAVFGSIFAMLIFSRKGNDFGAFLASSFYLAFMLVGAVFALYPVILPAVDARYNLTVQNSVTAGYALAIGLRWWSVGIVLAIAYFFYVYRSFRGKVKLEGSEHGY